MLLNTIKIHARTLVEVPFFSLNSCSEAHRNHGQIRNIIATLDKNIICSDRAGTCLNWPIVATGLTLGQGINVSFLHGDIKQSNLPFRLQLHLMPLHNLTKSWIGLSYKSPIWGEVRFWSSVLNLKLLRLEQLAQRYHVCAEAPEKRCTPIALNH